MTQYSLLEIQSIKENLNEFMLENDVSKNIVELFNLLNLSQNRPKIVRKERTAQDENGKWMKKEIFKATKIEKKEGIEEELDILRSLLNKLVENNYEEQKNKIFDCIKSILEMDTQEKYDKIIERLYVLIVNNQRYSKTYATIFSSLLEEFFALEQYQNIFVGYLLLLSLPIH